MMKNLERNEWHLITSALEETIQVLEWRFEDDDRYIHPALKYKELLNKINEQLEKL